MQGCGQDTLMLLTLHAQHPAGLLKVRCSHTPIYHPSFLKPGDSQSIWLDWLLRKLQRLSCLSFPRAKITGRVGTLRRLRDSPGWPRAHCVTFVDLELRIVLPALPWFLWCWARTLPIEPHLQLQEGEKSYTRIHPLADHEKTMVWIRRPRPREATESRCQEAPGLLRFRGQTFRLYTEL